MNELSKGEALVVEALDITTLLSEDLQKALKTAPVVELNPQYEVDGVRRIAETIPVIVLSKVPGVVDDDDRKALVERLAVVHAECGIVSYMAFGVLQLAGLSKAPYCMHIGDCYQLPSPDQVLIAGEPPPDIEQLRCKKGPESWWGKKALFAYVHVPSHLYGDGHLELPDQTWHTKFSDLSGAV